MKNSRREDWLILFTIGGLVLVIQLLVLLYVVREGS